MKKLVILLFIGLIILTLSCKKDDDGGDYDKSGKLIITFKIESILLDVSVDQVLHKIDFNIPPSVTLTNVTPSIKVSQGASINPSSGQPIDLTEPVIYTVTAEDGSTSEYTVMAGMALDTAFIIIDMQITEL